MPIIASANETKNYTPAPEGVHQAVCVDVLDLGLVKSQFPDEKTGKDKFQHKVNVVWQIEEKRDDGKRYLLYKRYTLSLHEKAALRHDLESWRGRAFTFDELAGFDVEKLKTANCFINVQHKKSADGQRTYANVISVMPLPKNLKLPKMEPLDYERAVPATATSPVHQPDQEPPHTDEDVSVPDFNDSDEPPF
jgi:hypothetical protein